MSKKKEKDGNKKEKYPPKKKVPEFQAPGGLGLRPLRFNRETENY